MKKYLVAGVMLLGCFLNTERPLRSGLDAR